MNSNLDLLTKEIEEINRNFSNKSLFRFLISYLTQKQESKVWFLKEHPLKPHINLIVQHNYKCSNVIWEEKHSPSIGPQLDRLMGERGEDLCLHN